MPLVQHNGLPSIDRVQSEGVSVCVKNNIDPNLPKLKIGFLNMMPDAAISATERQFLRLLGSNDDVNCYFYPFNISGVDRSPEAQNHIDSYYINFEKIKAMQLDALVVTGANVSQPLLSNEKFWGELTQVLAWARENVSSIVCSCLATHAAVKVFYGVDRKHLGDKCWGVFKHEIVDQHHELTNQKIVNVTMCHSRFNDISENDFTKNNVSILIKSDDVGVQLAAEEDLSVIYFQGHPEYDDISLLKEYKREIINYLSGAREDYPPVPQNYFDMNALKVANEFKDLVLNSAANNEIIQSFPEEQLKINVRNEWEKSANSIFSNWLDHIAKLKNNVA